MRITLTLTIIMSVSGTGSAATELAHADFPELRGVYFGLNQPSTSPTDFGAEFLTPPDGFHSSAVFSPDGREVLWTAMGEQTYVSRMQAGVWSRPEPMAIEPDYGIGEPFFSRDGSRLYYLCRRPLPDDPVERERIWLVDRTDSGWMNPRPIDSCVRAHPTHWQFSLAANGNLYFTSETRGVRGKQDIYMARWIKDHYAEPVDLGPAVNSDYRDLCPYVAPDESYLLFARTIPEESSRTDLMISVRDDNGNWTKAGNLGDEINSLHNEVCPVVTPDGRFLIYLSLSGDINRLRWVSTESLDHFLPRSGE